MLFKLVVFLLILVTELPCYPCCLYFTDKIHIHFFMVKVSP